MSPAKLARPIGWESSWRIKKDAVGTPVSGPHHDQLGHLLFAIQYHYLTIVLYIIYVSLECFEILDRRWILDSFETLNRSRAFTQRLSNVYVY
jgi:hypothetical protein